jgi:hypothetical protein
MGMQVCFTADDNLVSIVDEIAKKFNRSRSDMLNLLVWIGIQNVRAKQPQDFGEFMSISAGTGFTAPAPAKITHGRPETVFREGKGA